MFRRLTLSLTLPIALFATTAMSEQIGVVDAAQADAFQARSSIGHPISFGESVFRNARLYTKSYGTAKILLRDGSDLMITPNSSIVLDEYVFADDGAQSMALSLTKGALRMVSGRMQKEAVVAKTAIALIGIRGTQFWLDVDTPDLLRIWIQDGTVIARPVGTDEEFVFPAPAYAECTTTTCEITEPPELPVPFPTDPRSR